jgi:hypothetical protein
MTTAATIITTFSVQSPGRYGFRSPTLRRRDRVRVSLRHCGSTGCPSHVVLSALFHARRNSLRDRRVVQVRM